MEEVELVGSDKSWDSEAEVSDLEPMEGASDPEYDPHENTVSELIS